MNSRAFICFAVLGLVSPWVIAADQAVVKNKVFDSQHKELDTAVYVTKVNELDMEEGQDEIEVSPGNRILEVACIVRTFVGMGTVDLGKSTRMSVTLAAGRTYRLDAKLTKDGDCTPILQ
jgi:hypothetical protein